MAKTSLSKKDRNKILDYIYTETYDYYRNEPEEAAEILADHDRQKNEGLSDTALYDIYLQMTSEFFSEEREI